MSLNDRVVIIGAGIFGLSTAVELSDLGYKDIVVLDRHVPPVNPLSCLFYSVVLTHLRSRTVLV